MLARRCRFILQICFVVLATGNLPATAQEDRPAPVLLPHEFPHDRYTPHGYLDNPFHSLVFNRSGIIRSYPALGFGWWRTDFHRGAYALGDRDHMNYISLLRIAVTIDGAPFFAAADFAGHNVDLASTYHTKSVMSFDWQFHEIQVRLLFFLAAEDALVSIAEFSNTGAEVKLVNICAIHHYVIGNTRWWGSDGITARADPDSGLVVGKIWAYGDVFALGASAVPRRYCVAAHEDTVVDWMSDGMRVVRQSEMVQGRGPLFGALNAAIAVPPHGRRTEVFCLARGRNESRARQTLRKILPSATDSLERKLEEDKNFWRFCPFLEGDWPEHWRRGWVYDFETLRMNVRPPIGIFRHRWDGMQVHAPRVVLGETSLDMLALSVADPGLAKEVMFGTFADALAPNVPCVREDGSVNMIGADGSECGTAPMWGYPFKTIRTLTSMTGDTAWLRRVYPYIRAYVLWWLDHRTDAAGWLHCNNSWESGQDGSRRFLVASGNEGATADFVRTVDVEASMAEALRVLEWSARILGLMDDAGQWASLYERRVVNTRAMFYGNRYYDVDGRDGQPIRITDYYDIMMLAPLTCGVAAPNHVTVIKPAIRRFATDSPRALQWPPGLYTYAEAAWYANERQSAADVIAATAERVYKRIDARTTIPGDDPYGYRVPGIANEYWPVRDMSPGAENYGWGATLPAFILRVIAGFRETDDSPDTFTLAPCLPRSFLKTRGNYTISKLRFCDVTCSITMTTDSTDHIRTRVRYAAPASLSLTVLDGRIGRVVAATTEGTSGVLDLNGPNGTVFTVQLHRR